MKRFVLSFSAAALLVSAVSFTGGPAVAATDYPWCARLPGFEGNTPKCSYSTYEQCQATAAYSNGWCERNARIVEQEQQAKRGVR
jgi:hypothetical protein